MGIILEGPDLVLPAASSGTVTAADITDSSASGRDLLTRGSLASLATLGLADVMGYAPGPTWSAVGGGGTAAIANAQASLTLATGVAPGSWSLAPKAIAATSRTYYALDARARLNSITGGDNTNTYVSLRLCTSGSDNTGALANLRCDGNLALVVHGISGGGTVGSPVTLSRGDLTGGNLWLRLVVVNASRLVLLYGTGVDGAEPLAWTEVASTTVTLGWSAAVFSHATVALDAAPGGSADDVAVVWSDVSVRGLS